MIAFKFLARGAVGPFTGFAWPTPTGSGPGGWVEMPADGLPDRGIHACLTEDLSFWIDEELWIVELGDLVQRSSGQLISSRGRLLQRTTWAREVANELGKACTFKARDAAAQLLRRNGRVMEADRLLSCPDLPELQRVAREISQPCKTDFLANLAGFVADAARRANIGDIGTVTHIVAEFARASAGPMAADLERAWQGRWIAERLELPKPDERPAV
jgi:hypothetical protein